jgi:hypothetical protein
MVGSAAGPEREVAAASRHARAVEVGRAFAEIVRDEPAVRELWVTADTEEPGIHLWLITDPLDWEAEGSFHGAPSDAIEERFPGEYVWVHVRNPLNFIGGDTHSSLRQDAEQIPLRAD